MVAVIGFALSGQCDYRAVVVVIIPKSVEAVTTGGFRPHQFRALVLILIYQNDVAATCRRSGDSAYFSQDVHGRGVKYLLCRVETITIQVEFSYPIRGIR